MLHRAAVDGPDLEYELRGTGKPIPSSGSAKTSPRPLASATGRGHPGQGGRSLSSAGIYGSGYHSAIDAGRPRGFEQAAAGAGAVLHPPPCRSSLTGRLARRQNDRFVLLNRRSLRVS
jgi:hypothetical protein